VFDGSTTYVDGTTTLADHLNYVESVLGDGSISIASIQEQTTALGGKITLSVNANHQISGLELGVDGTSSYFTIVSSAFQLVDTSSGQTLIPLSYVDDAWTFNSNVTINGALIVNGSVGTGAIDPGSITNTTYSENTATTALGMVNGAPVQIGSLTLTDFSGTPVTVDVVCTFVNADGDHDQNLSIVLLRDGSKVGEPFYCFARQNSAGFSGGAPITQPASFFDAGATAGAHTWTVTAQVTGGTSNQTSATLCRIILQDLKTEA
jgi:hypothetical protein